MTFIAVADRNGGVTYTATGWTFLINFNSAAVLYRVFQIGDGAVTITPSAGVGFRVSGAIAYTRIGHFESGTNLRFLFRFGCIERHRPIASA